MDRKPVSDPALAALGKFQGKIDRNSNFRQQAVEHNIGRNVRVIKLLGYLALLRQKGVPLNGVVDCVAATRQNFSSSKTMMHMGLPTGETQAAHFLPGQLRIGGREISQFATNSATRNQIEFLFAEVEHLPVTFNQADTAAEAKGQSGGLCAALVQACTILIRHKMTSRIVTGQISLGLLQAGYGGWLQFAIEGLRDAFISKGEKPGIPPLEGNPFDGYTPESISARSAASTRLVNRDESLRVLQYYMEDQQQRTWHWVFSNCQGTLREVESFFKG